MRIDSLPARRRIAEAVLLLVISAGVPLASRTAAPDAPITYTYVHHAVSTGVPAAQAAFDRGLTLVFAYNPEEAE